MINPSSFERNNSKIKIFLLILTLAQITLLGCENDLSKVPGIKKEEDFSKSIAKEVTIIISQNAITKAKITAPTFLSNEEAKPPYLEMSNGVKAVFYDNDLTPESVLTAKYARYYDETKNILVKDSVVVVNADSNKLFTEELIWNNNLEKFYSEKQVVIYGKDQIIYGDGLEANKDFTVFKIIRQRGVIPVAKGTIPTN